MEYARWGYGIKKIGGFDKWFGKIDWWISWLAFDIGRGAKVLDNTRWSDYVIRVEKNDV